MSSAPRFGRLPLLIGVVAQALLWGSWGESVRQAAAWGAAPPEGWRSAGGLPSASPHALDLGGPARPGGEQHVIGAGERWEPRPTGAPPGPQEVSASGAIPAGGHLELWGSRPDQPFTPRGGVGLRLRRPEDGGVLVLQTGQGGVEAATCGPIGGVDAEGRFRATVRPDGGLTWVEVNGVGVACPIAAHTHSPAVVAGEQRVALSELRLGGRESPAPIGTPPGLFGGLAALLGLLLFLIEGWIGIGVLASLAASAPLALALPLSVHPPPLIGPALGLGDGAGVAWALPGAAMLFARTWIHSLHSLRRPPGARDWPAAAPLAAAVPASLSMLPLSGPGGVGVGLIVALSAGLGLPVALRGLTRTPHRAAVWMLLPGTTCAGLAGLAHLPLGAIAAAAAAGLAAGVGAAALALPGAPRWVPAGALLAGVMSAELVARGLLGTAPPDHPAPPAGPGQVVLAGSPLVLDGGGAGPAGGPRPGPELPGSVAVHGAWADAFELVERVGGLASSAAAVAICLDPDLLRAPRARGPVPLAAARWTRRLLHRAAPAQLPLRGQPEARGAELAGLAADLHPRPLLIVIPPGPAEGGALRAWTAALERAMGAHPHARLLDLQGDPPARALFAGDRAPVDAAAAVRRAVDRALHIGVDAPPPPPLPPPGPTP